MTALGFYDPAVGGPHARIDEGGIDVYLPFDVEARVGLGEGFELGWKGLTSPLGGDLKYSILDERRHVTPISLALDIEAGFNPFVTFSIAPTEGGIASSAPFVYAGGGVFASTNMPVTPTLAFRPILNVGIRTGAYFEQILGMPAPDPRVARIAAGMDMPVRSWEDQAITPHVGVTWEHALSGGDRGVFWLGLAFESWLDEPVEELRSAGEL